LLGKRGRYDWRRCYPIGAKGHVAPLKSRGGTRKCVQPLVIAASFVIGLIVRLAEIESANQVIEGRHVARHLGRNARAVAEEVDRLNENLQRSFNNAVFSLITRKIVQRG
jgi:hypothetical protein